MPEETESLAMWSEMLAAFKAVPKEHRATAIELVHAVSVLGPNAIEILRQQAAGLVVGLPYGDWNDDRDMVKEAIAEARDGANYMQRERIRLEQVIRAQGLFTAAHAALLSAQSR